MKLKIFILISTIVCQFSLVAQSNNISLFNGENLDGWIKHGTELWYASDGEIVCES